MKHLLVASLLLLASLMGYSQSVRKDSLGNYYAVKMPVDSIGGRNTGKTFMDGKEQQWPVYESKGGKLYVIRVSKSGNQYKQYLKLNN